MPKQVRITKDDQESYVLAESVAVWEAHGWTAETSGKKPAQKKSEAKSESTDSGE